MADNKAASIREQVPDSNLEVTHEYSEKDMHSDSPSEQFDDGYETPTDEELVTLRRVVGKVPWIAYTVGFAEFCERFSYYGTTAVCMLPPQLAH